MDRKISRAHLQIMRQYVKLHFEEYYTENEIMKYEEQNILDRISEFNRTGTIKKRTYKPRPKKVKETFGYEYREIKIIFD